MSILKSLRALKEQFKAALPAWFGLCFAFTLILRRAWVTEDAFITLRTVDNFVNGLGLTWNPDERVQAYTHPLWMFVLSVFYFVTREPFYTTLLVGLGISTLCLILLTFRVAKSAVGALIGLLILSFSNAFVDFSTSGMENPLTHLLLVLFAWAYFEDTKSTPNKLRLLSFLAALGILTRMDTALIYAPCLGWEAWKLRKQWKPVIVALVVGQLPFIIWELFSLFYYGFLFPNTAYAKLNTGIPSSEIWQQGWLYYLSSLDRDPLTLFGIVMGLVLAWSGKKKEEWALAVGVVLYSVYVAKVGGDFMLGRFLTPALVCSMILVVRKDWEMLEKAPSWLAAICGAIVLLGFCANLPTIKVIPENEKLFEKAFAAFVDRRGVCDERLYYAKSNGLAAASRTMELPSHRWRLRGTHLRLSRLMKKVLARRTVGMVGFYAGPDVHIVDTFALTDPLLARLPVKRKIGWRIGHFERILPNGYLETIEKRQNLRGAELEKTLDDDRKVKEGLFFMGTNCFGDRNLAAYYDVLSLIIRGNLWGWERFKAIVKVNLGLYNRLIDFDTYRYPQLVKVRLEKVSEPKPEGLESKRRNSIFFRDSGVEVSVEKRSFAEKMEISLDHTDDYKVVFLRDKEEVGGIDVAGKVGKRGLTIHQLKIPASAYKKGFDKIRVLPMRGDNRYSMGHLLLM